jgi:HEPN domain-containing protein
VPPGSPAPGTPQDWLARAHAKLLLARVPLPVGGMWEDLCFWAQQSAELAIKAVYQQHGWIFPFIHDLAQLLNGLRKQGLTIPSEVQEAQKLSVYATVARYPGLTPLATHADYDEAIKIAQDVVSWASSLVP